MRVIIIGCGRVGSELTIQLGKAGHDVTIVDKRPSAFDRLPPGFEARTMVGLGFDRELLEEAGVKEADAFISVTNGDNSNIVSARVAREYFHVPKVIARIYDPRRAEIYERLNIPTVATTTWGVKQILLMLSHARLVGKPVRSLNVEGKILVAGVDRGGHGFIPVGSSAFQEGDVVHLILHKDAVDLLDELLAPAAEH